jgi:hypothetical protein
LVVGVAGEEEEGEDKGVEELLAGYVPVLL